MPPLRLLLTLTALLLPALAAAQPGAEPEASQPPLRVGYTAFAPLVIESPGGQPGGFDIELMRLIAADLDREVSFEKVDRFEDLLKRVEQADLDAAVAGITITANREKRFDFSHPYLPSGLRILARPNAASSTLTILSRLFSRQSLPWLGGAVLFILVSAVLVWWCERGSQECFSDDPYPGIFEALYWVVVTMSTVGYGDYAPKRPLGRLLTILLIFTGISVYGTLIAKGTSLLTVSSMEGGIESPADFNGRRVATVRGTTSVDVLRSHRAVVYETEDFEGACAMLVNGDVAAVVFDEPMVLAYAHGEGSGEVIVAGERFDAQNYGIALPDKSPLRESFNRSLLELQANGVYEKLHAKYFGEGL